MNIINYLKLSYLSLLLGILLSSCNYSAIQPFCPQNAIEFSNISIVNANCDLNNGSITITVIGDNGNLLYSIDSINFQSTGSFENLSTGSYFLQVKNAMGCFIILQYFIGNQPFDVNPVVLVQDATCGVADGAVTVTTGGIGGLSYSIDGGTFQSDSIFNNLFSGDYQIIIKDSNGCTLSQSFNIAETNDLDFIATTTNSNCGLSNGSINITASGGGGTYTYSLDGGQFKPINNFKNLTSGLYQVTIKDGNGCQFSKGVIVSDNVSFTVSIESTNANCENADGTINVVVTGGSGVFQYQLDNGNFQQNPLFTNLLSGSYIITVQDESGCEVSREGVVQANTSTVNLSFTTLDAGCGTNNGSIEVMASGGSGNFSYSLNGSSFQSNPVFSNLGRGAYGIIVQDDIGCSVTDNVSIMSGVSFQNQVGPIISTNCAISGCHASGTQRVNFEIFANIQARAAEIKSRTSSRDMPRGGGSLTQDEIDLIACWVDDGALDN